MLLSHLKEILSNIDNADDYDVRIDLEKVSVSLNKVIICDGRKEIILGDKIADRAPIYAPKIIK